MRSDLNVRAVKFIADALTQYQELPSDYVDVLVDLADSACTKDEWSGYVISRFPSLPYSPA